MFRKDSKLRTVVRKTCAAIAFLGMAASAQAATVSFMYGLPIIEATTEITQTGFLAKFDGSLGTLTGAKLDIFGAGTTSITLQNNAATNVSGRANSTIDLGWTSSLAALDAVLADDIAMAFSTGGSLTYTPGQSRSFGPLTDNGTFNYDLAAILADLTGAGTFGITCESISGFGVIGGGGNLAASQTTTAGCGASIEYTFDRAVVQPVPEPGSLALLGLALGGIAMFGRRRKV